MAAVEANTSGGAGGGEPLNLSPRTRADMGQSMQSNNPLESLNMRADPDAQATVTDYLDFTEYLPSDMMRSLTLIGKLDQTYIDASSNMNKLTSQWGKLPTLRADQRPAPVQLRADISENLDQLMSSRISAYAEACRMDEHVNRHVNRVKTILSKLQTMRDNFSTEEQKSPVQTKSPQLSRAPKITLRVEKDGQTVRRPPRITVPGEVLAPYDVDFTAYTSSNEQSSDEESSASPPPRQTATPAPRIKVVKPPKLPKQKLPKTPRAPRPSLVTPGGVALSTSTALAQLKPPPENAVPGSVDAPWLQLTPYELAKLRKRMKKNAVWTPSDTMIARELKELGRGVEAYRAAKEKAEEEGRPFEPLLPAPVVDAESGTQHPPAGAISAEALGAEEVQLSNRGMKLNEAKKLKREALAKQAVEEAEESARKMADLAARMFSNPEASPSVAGSMPEKTQEAGPSNSQSSQSQSQSQPQSQLQSLHQAQPQTPAPAQNPAPASAPPPASAPAVPVPTSASNPPAQASAKPTAPTLTKAPLQVLTAQTTAHPATAPVPVPALGQIKGPSKSRVKKRKLDSMSEAGLPEIKSEVTENLTSMPTEMPKPQVKRAKTETPVPPPQLTPRPSSVPPPIETPVPPPQVGQASTVPVVTSNTPVPVPVPPASESSHVATKPTNSPASRTSPAPPATVTITTVPIKPPAGTPVPPPPAKTSTTPIPPPTQTLPKREMRKEQPKNLQPIATNTRQSTSRANTPAPVTTPSEPQSANSRRPTSRGGKAGSQEPPVTFAVERPRRASTARNTPAPEPRQPSKRNKRPAPGVVTTNSGGTSAVGTRMAAPRKRPRGPKRGTANAQQLEQEVEVEVDDDGNVIDPNEPRYCLCNRVSFGTMIQCDNIDVSRTEDDSSHTITTTTTATPARNKKRIKTSKKLTPHATQNCKQEWFHLECVGLTEIPARTTKWYCPECRVLLNIGGRGEVTSRGVKM
ncbi:uncharacterized protein BCR38DRAFT_520990 [Pseudomassariella vexata]|uniref:Inhibitor of growth protein N-terminal histone-binding domain-containing protein n=1 Tax=Pseudomassariella vexata TaxID=1141098 RepID=A0A1Y2EFG0_9PEZI|nr:uncharacterized protein BCR38DRAFT_520990 [Pseudomassariella vexata]ORY70147.1 hypothetical protein BCR38DRAFT_520990 [Pseudomassariella vexata]